MGEVSPGGARLLELVAPPRRDPVVAAVRPLVRRLDVRRQRPGLVETSQRAIDGRVADIGETGGAQPPDDVVSVPVLLRDDGERRGVERAPEQLAPIHFRSRHYYVPRSSASATMGRDGRPRLDPRHPLGDDPPVGDRPALLTVERPGRPARAEDGDPGGGDLRRRALGGADAAPEAAGRAEGGTGAPRSRSGRAEPDAKPGARDRAIGGGARRGAQSRAAGRSDQAEQGSRPKKARAEAPPKRGQAAPPPAGLARYHRPVMRGCAGWLLAVATVVALAVLPASAADRGPIVTKRAQ